MFFSWGTGAKFKSFFTMLWEAQVRKTSPKQMVSWKISKVPKGKRRGGAGGHFQSNDLCGYMDLWTYGIEEKKLQHDFLKMRGGGQRLFGTFPKTHPFWWRHPFLTLENKIASRHHQIRSHSGDKRCFPSWISFVICVTNGNPLTLWLVLLQFYFRILAELIFMLFFLSAGFESESMALRLPPQTSQRMARHSGDHQNINHWLHL